MPVHEREASTILGQLVFLSLCVPACYISDRLLARARALNRKTSRFPMMALAAAASSACSFVVIGDAPEPYSLKPQPLT